MTPFSSQDRECGNGLDALAVGFLDAGIGLTTNYPGFHSNELADRLGCTCTSVDEKTAYAVAWGAAAAGIRAVTTFKNVGLNDAADAFLNSMLLGINAGLVLVVLDDIDLEHSQSRMDSRHYFDFYGGLWFEPSSLRDAYDIAYRAHSLSEEYGVPIVIRITNVLYLKYGWFPRRQRTPAVKRPFTRDPAHFVVHPVNAGNQLGELRQKCDRIQAYVNTLATIEVATEACQRLDVWVGAMPGTVHPSGADRLWLKAYPLPEELLRSRLPRYSSVKVFEHGDPFVCNAMRALMAPDRICSEVVSSSHPNRKYHCSSDYEKLFALLRQRPERIVSGDLGQHTMDSPRTIDLCLCFGASVAVGIGAAEAGGDEKVICVTGDAAFLHSGKSAIFEALERCVQLLVIVLDNGGSRGTGGQRIPGDLEIADRGVRVADLVYADSTEADFDVALDKALEHGGISVLRVKT